MTSHSNALMPITPSDLAAETTVYTSYLAQVGLPTLRNPMEISLPTHPKSVQELTPAK